jgi:hypothetical protein
LAVILAVIARPTLQVHRSLPLIKECRLNS